MKKNWYTSLLAFAFYSTIAGNLSVRVNLGMSSTGHESKGTLIQSFDEIAAYEILDNFRGADNTNSAYAKLSAGHALEKVLREVFIQEDKTGKVWENTARTVYLAPVTIASDLLTLQISDATLLTGTPSSPTFTPKSLPTLAVTVDGGLTFSTASLTKYTAPGATLDSALPSTTVFIVSSDSFTTMTNLKNEIYPTVQLSSNYLKSQKHFNTLDGGITLGYDSGALHMFASLNMHYPMDLNPRETITLIHYSPKTNYDLCLGTLINYRKGRLGGSFGLSQITGDFMLTKYKRLTSGGTTDLQYVDYNNSYSDGQNSVSIQNVSDLFFFGELRAETMPLERNGLVLYSSYKIGFGRQDENAKLSKLDLKQDSITLGASYGLFDTDIDS